MFHVDESSVEGCVSCRTHQKESKKKMCFRAQHCLPAGTAQVKVDSNKNI